MTANQLALAANNEAVRHNSAVEAETQRHNLATEQLEEQQQSINREIAQQTYTYQSERNRIDAEYNKWYERWTEANEGRRRSIEQQLANIQQEKVNNELSHNIRMEELTAAKNDIDKQLANVEATWKEYQKAQQMAEWTTDVFLKEKELDYKNRALETQSTYWGMQVGNESLRIQNQWNIESQRLALESQKNALSALDMVFNAQLKKKKLSLDTFDTVSSLLLRTAEATIKGLNMSRLGTGGE